MHSQSHELVALRHVVTRRPQPASAPDFTPQWRVRGRRAIAILPALMAIIAAAMARLA